MGIEQLLRQQAEKAKAKVQETTLTLVEVHPPNPTQPTQPTKPSQVKKNKLTQPSQPMSTKPTQPTQPMRDFIKYPNSVSRNTDKLFRGMNKETYDKLYNLTRGAFPDPSRSIQIKKIELEKITGFSDNTLAKHLKDLQTVGLVKVTHKMGSHEGSIYEVLIPEELDDQPNQPDQGNQDNQPQKLGLDPPQKVGLVGSGKLIENKEDTESLRFKFKDMSTNDDDLTLLEFRNLLNDAAKKATGRNLTAKDLEALLELAEILINETELARTRTKGISVYLKFAVENLRRRLYAKTSAPKKSKENPAGLSVGKNTAIVEPEELPEIEPLTEELRNNALEIMRGMVRDNGIEALENLRTNYTAEDFEWLRSKCISED